MDAEMFLGDRKDDEVTELEARDELEEVFELADQVWWLYLIQKKLFRWITQSFFLYFIPTPVSWTIEVTVLY